MADISAAAQRYLQSVYRQLEVPKKDRQHLEERIEHAVTVFLEENPDATIGGICNAFGTPEEYAAEVLSAYKPQVVSAVRQKKKRRLYVVIVCMAALAVLMLGIAGYLYSNGGIVTIETFQYVNGENPNPRPPEGEIYGEYLYEEE